MSILILGLSTINLTACGNNSKIGYAKGLKFTLSADGKSYSVSQGLSEEKNIVIPAKYRNKPVTSISESAFFSNSMLETITIPDSITTIYDYAFYDCS